jgi:hypothetical protein
LYGPLDPDIALHGGYLGGKWYRARKLLKNLTCLMAVKDVLVFLRPPRERRFGERRIDSARRYSGRLRAAARSDQMIVIALQVAIPLLAPWLGGWRGLGLYLVVVPALTVLHSFTFLSEGRR